MPLAIAGRAAPRPTARARADSLALICKFENGSFWRAPAERSALKGSRRTKISFDSFSKEEVVLAFVKFFLFSDLGSSLV